MKKTVLALILAVAIIFCFSPGISIANDNYLTLKVGVYSPTGDLKDADFNNAFNGEVAIGHNFTRNFGVEFGIGHFETKATYSGYNYYLGNYSETDKVSVTPITLTARGIIPIEKVSLYAGAGIGLYFASGKADLTSRVINVSLSDNTNVLGFHVLAGLEYNFTPKVFAGIEAKHVWTEKASFSGTVYGIPIKVETNLNGFNMAAKIGFRF